MPADVTYRKACDCDAPASGPRVVIGEAEEEEDMVSFPVKLVRMACDECDTPWEQIEGEERDREALEELEATIGAMEQGHCPPRSIESHRHALVLAQGGADMEALTDFGVGDRIVWSGDHEAWGLTRPDGTGFRPLYAGSEEETGDDD